MFNLQFSNIFQLYMSI